MQRRFNGSAWIDPAYNRRWNGSAWQDCEFLRRWNGSAWVDVWTGRYFHNSAQAGKNAVSTISNGVWTASAQGQADIVAGASLWLVPELDWTVPLTLEVDWQASLNGAQLEVGSLDSGNNVVSGNTNTVEYGTGSTFSRRIDTYTVSSNTNATHLGVVIGVGENTYYSASCTVYGIKINGESIPIE